jgi:hypothetical protein
MNQKSKTLQPLLKAESRLDLRSDCNYQAAFNL